MSKITLITKKTEVITLKTGPRGPQGIQGPKGDQGDVSIAQLNTKVDKTTTVNNQPLSSNITINASGVPNTPAGNISATSVQNALNELDTEKVDKLMATNLAINGDFSNGTTGWGGSNGTIANESGRLAITPTAQFGGGIHNFNTIVNNVYYIAILIEGTIGNNYINVSDVGATNIVLTQNTQRVSIRFTSPQISRFIRVADSRASGWTKFFVDNFLIIDLTTTFGAGNEPTREQMDRLLSVYPNSWFNGTSEIGSIGALTRATLGVQVVTPTLLNTRTGTAQYVVSNDGLVIFRGTASGGSLNTNIFVLPENIRPIATRTFPISANSAFGVITVATNGEVRQTVGALTNVFLDGIVFKVGV